MSRIKNLKNQSDNCINIVEILSLICFENKSKYVEPLLRIIKKRNRFHESSLEIKDLLVKKYNVNKDILKNLSETQIIFFYKFISDFLNEDEINMFQKFSELNERGLIEKNDLSKYSTFEEIRDQLNVAEIKLIDKELESQIVKIHNDNEWLVLRPLTYEASKRYGSNTKWCTTHSNDSTYFRKYAGRGVLLYTINKKTGLKVACYKDINEIEFSFWNQKDERIDSIQSNLPDYILGIIKKEIKDKLVSNLSLIGEKYEEDNKFISIFDTDQVELPNEMIMEEEIEGQIPRLVEPNILASEEDISIIRRFANQRINENVDRVYIQQEIPFSETNNRA